MGHLFRVSRLFACKDTAFCVTEKVYWYFLCGVRMKFVNKYLTCGEEGAVEAALGFFNVDFW